MMMFNKKFKDINNEQLHELLHEEDVQFVDVRTKNEYIQRTIAGFDINIDYYQMVRNLEYLNGLNKEKPVVLMCATGVRSRVVAEIMGEIGFQSIYNLRNGIAMWDGKTV